MKAIFNKITSCVKNVADSLSKEFEKKSLMFERDSLMKSVNARMAAIASHREMVHVKEMEEATISFEIGKIAKELENMNEKKDTLITETKHLRTKIASYESEIVKFNDKINEINAKLA